jgi:hypothetical protein
MPAYTSRLALPYPLGTDPPNGPGQIESLANVLDTAVGSTLLTVFVAEGAAEILFSSIPQAFNHLLLKMVARSAYTGAEFDRLNMIVDGYVGPDYDVLSTENLAGTFTSLAQVGSPNATIGVIAAGGATANVAGTCDIEIPCYTQTVFDKVATARSGYFDGLAGATVYWEHFARVHWRLTAGINQIALTLASGAQFVDGSAFYLYGLN